MVFVVHTRMTLTELVNAVFAETTIDLPAELVLMISAREKIARAKRNAITSLREKIVKAKHKLIANLLVLCQEPLAIRGDVVDAQSVGGLGS